MIFRSGLGVALLVAVIYLPGGAKFSRYMQLAAERLVDSDRVWP
jgi:hypothetical protein